MSDKSFIFIFLISLSFNGFRDEIGLGKKARFVDDVYFYFISAGLRLRGREGEVGIVYLIWPCGGKGWCWARLCMSEFWCSDAGDGWRTDG